MTFAAFDFDHNNTTPTPFSAFENQIL